MFFVVDTNIVISALLKKSVAQELLLSRKFSLFAPDYLASEIIEHKKELLAKSKLPEEKFMVALSIILSCIIVIPKEEYQKFKKEAVSLSPDFDDWPFFALCLKFRIPLWSNDKKLKEQNRVEVFNTSEILKDYEKSKK